MKYPVLRCWLLVAAGAAAPALSCAPRPAILPVWPVVPAEQTSPGPNGEAYFADPGLELAGPAADFLASIGEPPLVGLPRDSHPETYRFVLLSPFLPPRSVRLEVDGGSLRVDLAWKTGILDPAAGPAEVRESRVLAPVDSAGLLDLLRQVDVFGMECDTWAVLAGSSLDGSTWIVEGLAGGRYHVVSREAPDRCVFHRPDDIIRQQTETWERLWRYGRTGHAGQFTPDRDETVRRMADDNVRLVRFVRELFRTLGIDDYEFESCGQDPGVQE